MPSDRVDSGKAGTELIDETEARLYFGRVRPGA